MILLFDENVDQPIARRLRRDGHEMPRAFTVVSPGLIRVRRRI